MANVLVREKGQWPPRSNVYTSTRGRHICAILLDGRFDDAQESRFQGAKLSNMGSAVQQWGRLTDALESCIPGR